MWAWRSILERSTEDAGWNLFLKESQNLLVDRTAKADYQTQTLPKQDILSWVNDDVENFRDLLGILKESSEVLCITNIDTKYKEMSQRTEMKLSCEILIWFPAFIFSILTLPTKLFKKIMKMKNNCFWVWIKLEVLR